MEQNLNLTIGMVDRVLRLEPQLRLTIAAASATTRDALNKAFMEFSNAGLQLPDRQAWTAGSREYERIEGAIREAASFLSSLRGERFTEERHKLKVLVDERDEVCVALAQTYLEAARRYRDQAKGTKNARLKELTRSAMECAMAMKLLASRIAVVNAQGPTLGDTSW